ncbi:MAG: tRNA (guanosine(37)-N1)-methyltransferase TrmD [Lachnospiraceae bacterium]|nr:tRNA (guanosine(37)-N1)-methyltransferase TrmD [Lachnospiraceae bacterium]
MNFHVMTLFPDMVQNGLMTSIIGRAVENNYISVNTYDIRDYTTDKHKKVDDYPYGGGAGMLMQAQPVFDCAKTVKERIGHDARVIFMTPQGRTFNQRIAEELSKEEDLIFLCGHYEGIDERVLEEIVTDEISIGDYVLTGGEMAAMIVIDAVSRLVPGVLSNEDSGVIESFSGSLLEYPQYSRPEVWMGKSVPEVLLSGNHKEIEKWRLETAKERTLRKRPDLYKKYERECEIIDYLNKEKAINADMTEAIRLNRLRIIYDSDGVIGLIDVGKTKISLYAKDDSGLGEFYDFTRENGLEGIPILLRGMSAEALSDKGYKISGEFKEVAYTRGVPIGTKEVCDEATENIRKEINDLLLTGELPVKLVPVNDTENLAVYEKLQFRISKKSLYFCEPLC